MTGNLPKPIKKQREVLYMPAIGHTAVLGTAGSGKTTLALYRAIYLSDSSLSHSGRVLLLTYNKALVTYLNYLKPTDRSNICIETYHTFARGYLNARGKMEYNCICSNIDERQYYISKAVKAIKEENSSSTLFNRPIDFFSDEIQWMLGKGIETSDAYVEVERTGRFGTKLSRKFRPVMFKILNKYLELRTNDGNLYDWDDM